MTQPIPFPYYHTLTLMLSLNLLLIAYSMIEFETVMTIPCFFIIVLVCLGLKETAVALADPFGGDDVDFETEVRGAAAPFYFLEWGDDRPPPPHTAHAPHNKQQSEPSSPHSRVLQVYMANMLANTKAMISPSADYTPLMLPLAGAKPKAANGH